MNEIQFFWHACESGLFYFNMVNGFCDCINYATLKSVLWAVMSPLFMRFCIIKWFVCIYLQSFDVIIVLREMKFIYMVEHCNTPTCQHVLFMVPFTAPRIFWLNLYSLVCLKLGFINYCFDVITMVCMSLNNIMFYCSSLWWTD